MVLEIPVIGLFAVHGLPAHHSAGPLTGFNLLWDEQSIEAMKMLMRY